VIPFTTPAGTFGFRFRHRGRLYKREGDAKKSTARTAEWVARGAVCARGPREAEPPSELAVTDYVAQ